MVGTPRSSVSSPRNFRMNAHHLPHLERAIANGNAILFLGAGASAGCLNNQGEPLLSTPQLAETLATESGFSYTNESLDEVYAAAKQVLGTNLSKLLERNFRHCRPSDDFLALARYPWTRIYTTNIDDAFERSLETSDASNPQRLRIQTRKSQFVDRDQTYSQLDLVKLHGSIDRLHEGVIFSSTEYAIEAANPSPWYSQIGYDYQNYSFIIIGSSLKESLFYQHVQYAREKIRETSPQSYLIVPCMSELQRTAVIDKKIKYIQWTLTDFVCWLEKQFPSGLDYVDVAANNNPSIRMLLTGKRKDLARRAKALSDVTQVQPNEMRSTDLQPGRIRNFYRGFKAYLGRHSRWHSSLYRRYRETCRDDSGRAFVESTMHRSLWTSRVRKIYRLQTCRTRIGTNIGRSLFCYSWY